MKVFDHPAGKTFNADSDRGANNGYSNNRGLIEIYAAFMPVRPVFPFSTAREELISPISVLISSAVFINTFPFLFYTFGKLRLHLFELDDIQGKIGQFLRSG